MSAALALEPVTAPAAPVVPMTVVMTPDDKEAMQRMADAVQRRQARRTKGLTELLISRPDLVGAHAPADFAVEAMRWAV